MSASIGTEKAAQQVHELLANPYVRRVVEDPAIRDNARVAYDSAREAIERAKHSDNLVNALFDDRKLQADLRTLGESVAEARGRLVQPPKRRKRRWGRAILLLGVGAVLAIALSEGLRNKVLDVLFGAEEEFDYVSTTAPPEPVATPAPPVSEPEPEIVAEAVEAEPEPVEEDAGKA